MNIQPLSSTPLYPSSPPADRVGSGLGGKYRNLSKGLAFATILLTASPVFSAAVAPDLGAAFDYLFLGLNSSPTDGTVTCTNSNIYGNIGSSSASITNTGCTITGVTDVQISGAVTTDFNNAYGALNTENPDCDGTIPTTNTTLAPGVYCSAAGTTIDADVTLLLDGDASDVWVFRVGTGGGGAFTGTGFHVVMGGTAQACNVYWGSAEAFTLTDSNFKGTILAGTDFTMTGGSFEGRALATNDATVTNLASMTFAGCAAPAVVTVYKEFNPSDAASVLVSLNCSSGTVMNTPLEASEGAPALFTVAGASPGASCTATEAVPLGYSADQSDCMGVMLGDSCTITNTLSSETVVVNKDFSPNSSASVMVHLGCTSGTITTTPLAASEVAPAIFTVTGADPGAICIATETVPLGYSADQTDCMGVALGNSCTIFNTLNSDTIVVHKDFSPNSPALVDVELTCTSGIVTTTPLQASELQPAVFTVTGASPGTTCTATETVPLGYSDDQSDCMGVMLGNSCTIINTRNSDIITVHKVFSDDNPATVEVALRCSSGTITTTPLDAATERPAVFTVTGAEPGTTCSATERVPEGYTADQTPCARIELNGSCTITNRPLTPPLPPPITIHTLSGGSLLLLVILLILATLSAVRGQRI